jgi:hypothetical protein
MAPVHLLWFLLAAEPGKRPQETLATAEILEPAQVAFSLEADMAEEEPDSTIHMAPETTALVLKSPDHGTALTIPLPYPHMVNAVSVSVSVADPSEISGETMGDAIAVIAQFN